MSRHFRISERTASASAFFSVFNVAYLLTYTWLTRRVPSCVFRGLELSGSNAGGTESCRSEWGCATIQRVAVHHARRSVIRCDPSHVTSRRAAEFNSAVLHVPVAQDSQPRAGIHDARQWAACHFPGSQSRGTRRVPSCVFSGLELSSSNAGGTESRRSEWGCASI